MYYIQFVLCSISSRVVSYTLSPLVCLSGFLLCNLLSWPVPFWGHLWESLLWIWPSALGRLRNWDGVDALLGIRALWHAYLNILIPAPSYQCGRWTLILCAGTLDCCFLLFMKVVSITTHEVPLVYFRRTNCFHNIFGVSHSKYSIHAILAIQFGLPIFLTST